MAKYDVYLNNRSIIHKGSADKAIDGSDICKTQIGNAVVNAGITGCVFYKVEEYH
ncbi:MAG: hypothetical protein GY787_14915 [Alteromonadales bacterium]|nr:hypothetical protein [Alteromonadales bacterium]